MSRRQPFSEQLRAFIRDCDMSQYALSKETGIDPATISKFMARKGGMSLANIEIITKLLRLDLQPRKD